MKNFYLTISLILFALANTYGQHNAIISVTDETTETPIENVNVTLNGETLITNSLGLVTFSGLSDNSYDYTFWSDCYLSGTQSLIIAGVDANENAIMTPTTTNDVFFFVGSPMALTGATVILTNNADFYQEFVTSDPWGGEIIAGVPFGDYSYTVTTPCYETVSGNVTVDCNEGLGTIVSAEPEMATTNDVFFFVGSPMALTGATVILTNNADFYQEFVTSDPWGGEVIAGVPFGEYSYTVTTPCYETVSGNVTVDCNDGQGTLVSAEPAMATTNDVFFFVGSPMALTGATVILTDNADFYQEFVTSDPWGGEIIADVPFGDYSYSITTPCYETVSGNVTVDCNEGSGTIVSAEPEMATTNDVFFFVGSPMALTGATVILTNNADFYQEFVTSDPWGGEVIAGVPFGDYSYTVTTPCYETVSGNVTVDCNEGLGTIVSAEPAIATSNDVFFYIGSPMTISGATVTLTDGADFNQSLITGAPFGDIMFAIPYGDYTYTIEANCYETITGTLTVDCNEGLGTLVEQIPTEIVIDNTVSYIEGILNATASGYNYQWIDCDNDNAEIEGETSQLFTPTVDGNYAVIISNESCSITSGCTAVIVTGLSDNQPSINVSVYPNPTSTDLKIQIESNDGKASVEVMTVAGQIVLNESFSRSEIITLNVSDFASGIYILNVTNDKGQFVTPIVKQ